MNGLTGAQLAVLGVEIWEPVPVPEYKDLYVVSNLGRCKRNKAGAKIVTPNGNGKGYLAVRFFGGVKPMRCYLHRMVAAVFHPNPTGLSDVNHIFTKNDNGAHQIEWMSQRDNLIHAVISGRAKYGYKGITRAVNLKTGETFTLDGHRAIINAGFIPSKVYNVINCKATTHRGHKFTREALEV